jgi:hypothetical protein
MALYSKISSEGVLQYRINWRIRNFSAVAFRISRVSGWPVQLKELGELGLVKGNVSATVIQPINCPRL